MYFALDVEKCGNGYVLYCLSMYVPLFYLEKYSGVLGKVRTRYRLKKSYFRRDIVFVGFRWIFCIKNRK